MAACARPGRQRSNGSTFRLNVGRPGRGHKGLRPTAFEPGKASGSPSRNERYLACVNLRTFSDFGLVPHPGPQQMPVVTTAVKARINEMMRVEARSRWTYPDFSSEKVHAAELAGPRLDWQSCGHCQRSRSRHPAHRVPDPERHARLPRFFHAGGSAPQLRWLQAARGLQLAAGPQRPGGVRSSGRLTCWNHAEG